jgi:Na+/H+-translocating membrane pyrophosphatase
MNEVNVLLPISISTILIGAMMPYAFSAHTMQSVGSAAAEMVLNK